MNQSFEQVLQAAKGLPDAERAQLVDSLIDTLQPEDSAPLEDAWLAEIARRSRELDDGVVQAIPWETVKERVWRRVFPNA